MIERFLVYVMTTSVIDYSKVRATAKNIAFALLSFSLLSCASDEKKDMKKQTKDEVESVEIKKSKPISSKALSSAQPVSSDSKNDEYVVPNKKVEPKDLKKQEVSEEKKEDDGTENPPKK